jgi:hypothetical protein
MSRNLSFASRSRRTSAVLVPAVAILICGCGEPAKADLKGVVTLNGKPPNFEGLVINFLGMDGRPIAAVVAPDGTYSASGVAVGEVRVGFSVTDPDGDRAWAAQGQAALGGEAAPAEKARPPADPAARRRRPTVPERYRDALKSGLITTTKPGANSYDVDIK